MAFNNKHNFWLFFLNRATGGFILIIIFSKFYSESYLTLSFGEKNSWNTNPSNTLCNSLSSYFVTFFWKTGLLILAFKCDIYGRVFSRPCSTLTSEANYSINFTQSGLFVLTFRSCSKTSWWVGYFIHFKCTRVFFYLMFLMISYYGQECQTFTIEQNWRSQNFNFLGKKIWRNALALKSKKVQGIFGETFILVLSSSAVFGLQNLSDFF